jgi:hypothetical protein
MLVSLSFNTCAQSEALVLTRSAFSSANSGLEERSAFFEGLSR